MKIIAGMPLKIRYYPTTHDTSSVLALQSRSELELHWLERVFLPVEFPRVTIANYIPLLLPNLFLRNSSCNHMWQHGSLHMMDDWPKRANFSKPQMWEQAQVGFGGTSRKCKGFSMKECAWGEARFVRHTIDGSMPSYAVTHCKTQSRRDAPKLVVWGTRAASMRLVEVQHRKHCCPETPLGRHFTSQA